MNAKEVSMVCGAAVICIGGGALMRAVFCDDAPRSGLIAFGVSGGIVGALALGYLLMHYAMRD